MSTVRSTIARVGLESARKVALPFTSGWRPFSRLFLVSDSPSWSIARDMEQLRVIATRFRIRVPNTGWLQLARNQSVFFGSQFQLLLGDRFGLQHRLGTAYFHGRPGTGFPGFDSAYQSLCRHHERLNRVQVSHREMMDVVLSSGISAEKVWLIRIGVDLSAFPIRTEESRREARRALGIPDAAVVAGSFQKDGVGWGLGLEPKLEKGPDVLLKTLEILHARIPELFVLLSGPARGYVVEGLRRLGIRFQHQYPRNSTGVGRLYQALDVYVISSRHEGGPKALLEAMATGIPVVTTRVGQAMDLVSHQENAWMVPPEDAEGLAHWAEYVVRHDGETRQVTMKARAVAEANAYDSQHEAWRQFLRGFVEIPTDGPA